MNDSKQWFCEEQLLTLNSHCIPRHVAIIPDGNRRWAKRHALRATFGHKKGADKLLDIALAACELGVKALTFYTFSTENWRRPQWEIDSLMQLLKDYLKNQTPRMLVEKVRLQVIGTLNAFPEDVIEVVETTKRATAACNRFELVLALNYGGRDEICRAMRMLAYDVAKQRLSPDEITEQSIGRYLDTAPWGDPELLIRSGGELRLSNFLLWQASYAELYVSDALWPDFTPQHLFEAIKSYQERDRRLGGGE